MSDDGEFRNPSHHRFARTTDEEEQAFLLREEASWRTAIDGRVGPAAEWDDEPRYWTDFDR